MSAIGHRESGLPAFLSGGGEMGERMRALDWALTPLGPAVSWPQSLRTAVRIMLTSRQPMFVWWGDQLINLYNDAYKAIVGGKHPAALGQPAAVVWREIWDQVGPRAESAMFRNEGTYDEALMLLMERNGYPEETYYTFSYSPVPNEEGGAGGIICANTDDTQRIIGERQLALLRELAAATVDARTVEDACRLAARALQTNRRDLPFASIYLFDNERHIAALAGASGIKPGHEAAPEVVSLDDPGIWPFAEMLRNPASTLITDIKAKSDALPTGEWDRPPIHAVLLPIMPQGQTGRAGVMVAGLSPYRLFNDNYRGFMGLVTGQIAAGIANAQAYQQERRRAEALAEIDRAKTAFFSNASHEFRTPLTLMLSPLEDLLVRSVSADSVTAERKEIEIIHRNGRRLLKLVNTLLHFSRLEAGRIQAAYEPTDLANYTAELASTFRSAMERAGLHYTVKGEPLPEPVYVDREMWETIVLNLISNAFKYTLEGEVEVTIRASADRAHAEFSVSDTGVGMPEHELPHLFERFHRIEGQLGRTHEGTGIGLALVQELVRLHGGAVRAQSALGKGSTFTVSIPLGRGHLPADRIGAGREPSSNGLRAGAFVEEALRWLPGPQAAGELTMELELVEAGLADAPVGERALVLLVDDNADMREYVRKLLSNSYRVQTAPDGQTALEIASRQRPDLILSDVMMPRLNGFGLLRAVRSNPGLRDVPVVLLSARAGEEASIEGLEAGADDYLAKPFSARELLARVRANLEQARVRGQAAEVLREETRRLETLNRTGTVLAAELDLERLVQTVTDAAVELTGAKFGAFFNQVAGGAGELLIPSALSGVPRDVVVTEFPAPRITALFAPIFGGDGVLRSDDILRESRYGKNPPLRGMPPGHLPISSFLAVPVVSGSGGVHGGLFLGHPERGVFTARHELIVVGIAAQAAIAMDNARLYRERRKAEEELRRLNETLEQRVADEVKERMNAEEALRQAQKMESIGQLTGGVAHDFNNLLQVILGNLEALQRRFSAGGSTSADEFRRLTEAAIRGGQRAATLTQRLLAFSRRQPLAPKPLDANRLVSGMSDLLRRSIGEGVTIETVLAGGVWMIYADANQLESALLNLAVNARDAMPNGGKLTIETCNSYLDDNYSEAHAEVTPGQYVMIAMSDTGVGMTREVIAKAFEPFFTTKQIGQGTGLGLSQVYGFVKQSGGHLKIYSEPGEGTTIRLYLPRLVAVQTIEDHQVKSIPAPTGDKGERILIVEDDADVRTNTAGMLRDLGYSVVEASDGREALLFLENNSTISLLFTDIGLPGGLNGRQLAAEVRRRYPALKVLFTTGYTRNAIFHQDRLDAGVELIVKPFTYTGLAHKIRHLLEREPDLTTEH